MSYRKLFLIILIVLLSFNVIPIQYVSADDDDFEVEYEFFPERMGYLGGDVLLTLTVENTGSSNITWVDVTVNTEVTYNSRWTGTITPGASRTITFTVPFTQDDLNVERMLGVTMNNNVSTNPDGAKIFKFTLTGTNQIVTTTAAKNPNQTYFDNTDTVEVTYTYLNTSTTHAVTNFIAWFALIKDGDELELTLGNSLGSIFPEASKSCSVDYDLSDYDPGHYLVRSYLSYSLMGEDYVLTENRCEFYIQPDISFRTTLYANPTVINPGDAVTFTITIDNGDREVDTFEITNSDDILIATTSTVTAGESRDILLEYYITEETYTSFTVTGYADGNTLSHDTNTVHITISESSATPSTSPTAVISAEDSPTLSSSEGSSEETPESLNETSASQSESTVSPAFNASADETSTLIDEEASSGTRHLLLIFIIFGGIIVTLIIVIIIVAANKNKKKDYLNFE